MTWPIPANNWTEERVAMLGNLLRGGLSAGQIAEEMGGITRNAVIGKARRLGLGFCATNPGGRPKSGRKPRAHPFVDRKPPNVAPGAIADLQPEIVANPVTLLELTEWTCRWPIGDPTSPDFVFCGALPVPGHSYCAGHCRLAYAGPVTTSRGERELMIRRMAKMRGAKVA